MILVCGRLVVGGSRVGHEGGFLLDELQIRFAKTKNATTRKSCIATKAVLVRGCLVAGGFWVGRKGWFYLIAGAQSARPGMRREKREDDEKQRARGVETRNRRKAQQTEGAGNTRRRGVFVGERKKISQQNVQRKASKVRLFREIVERIR